MEFVEILFAGIVVCHDDDDNIIINCTRVSSYYCYDEYIKTGDVTNEQKLGKKKKKTQERSTFAYRMLRVKCERLKLFNSGRVNTRGPACHAAGKRANRIDLSSTIRLFIYFFNFVFFPSPSGSARPSRIENENGLFKVPTRRISIPKSA